MQWYQSEHESANELYFFSLSEQEQRVKATQRSRLLYFFRKQLMLI